jgi:hypothetical protein
MRVACFEEKNHHEVEEVKKGGDWTFSKSFVTFFYFFDFAVKKFRGVLKARKAPGAAAGW